jgi:hypothetical protein
VRRRLLTVNPTAAGNGVYAVLMLAFLTATAVFEPFRPWGAIGRYGLPGVLAALALAIWTSWSLASFTRDWLAEHQTTERFKAEVDKLERRMRNGGLS